MSDTENTKPQISEDDIPAAADAAPQDEAAEPTPEDVIAQLTAEIDTLRDDRLRALADAQNTRRRAYFESHVYTFNPSFLPLTLMSL